MDVPQPQTLKFGLLSSAVTLKIKARSPKPNQAMSCPCKCESDLAHKITCKQESDTLLGIMLTPVMRPTPIGSAPKTIYCPPPFQQIKLI